MIPGTLSSKGGPQLPGTWSWDDEGRGMLPPGEHRSDRGGLALHWLVCIPQACSARSFASSKNGLTPEGWSLPSYKGFLRCQNIMTY